MILLRRSVLIVLVLLALPAFCLAGWVGPKEEVKGTWGKEPGQFGLESGDTDDRFPISFAVSESGKIAICDVVNHRVVVFRPDGSFDRNIDILTLDVVFDNNDSLYLNAKFRKFDKNGAQIFQKEIGFNSLFYVPDNHIVGYDEDANVYQTYSLSGQLISSTSKIPLELGNVTRYKEQQEGTVTTIDYDDAIYSILTPTMLSYFTRDSSRYLYGVIKLGLGAKSYYRVYKYNKCGKVLGMLDLPQDDVIVEPNDTKPPQPVSDKTLIAEYGEPLIALSGVVFVWKRTPDSYSILKWTWQDDANTPSCPDAKIKQAACDNTSFLKTDMRLAAADLAGKSKEDLRLMRNEIYARHGKTFQSADLQKYFSGKCWYKAEPGYSDTMLTPVDRENIRIIQDAEKGM